MNRSRNDPMLAGYQFAYGGDRKTPYDYITDPRTRRRPGENREPSSETFVNLEDGLEGRTIPPLKIWEQGFWYDDWDERALGPQPHTRRTTNEQLVWVTPGEGTPGNYQWRLYELPWEEGTSAGKGPRHPMSWPEKLRKRSYGSSWSSKADTGAKTTSTGLPYGVRVRCPGCGHWFRADDLPTHVGHTCPTAHGHNDWAIMCADECGCQTLDEVSTPKPGFPREKAATNGAVTGHKEEVAVDRVEAT